MLLVLVGELWGIVPHASLIPPPSRSRFAAMQTLIAQQHESSEKRQAAQAKAVRKPIRFGFVLFVLRWRLPSLVLFAFMWSGRLSSRM